MNDESQQGFEGIKERLDEIVEAVNDEGKTLDEALDLYEEAVKLGMQASSLLEEGLTDSNSQDDQQSDASLQEDSKGHLNKEENNAAEVIGEEPA